MYYVCMYDMLVVIKIVDQNHVQLVTQIDACKAH